MVLVVQQIGDGQADVGLVGVQIGDGQADFWLLCEQIEMDRQVWG